MSRSRQCHGDRQSEWVKGSCGLVGVVGCVVVGRMRWVFYRDTVGSAMDSGYHTGPWHGS